ncbi:hypothetical protein JCM33774_60660 [Actinophytocola sp. KF-1]
MAKHRLDKRNSQQWGGPALATDHDPGPAKHATTAAEETASPREAGSDTATEPEPDHDQSLHGDDKAASSTV